MVSEFGKDGPLAAIHIGHKDEMLLLLRSAGFTPKEFSLGRIDGHRSHLIDIIFDDASDVLTVQATHRDVISGAVAGTEEEIPRQPINGHSVRILDGGVDDRFNRRTNQSDPFHFIELCVDPENSSFLSIEIQLDGLKNLRKTYWRDDVIIRIVQVHPANFVGPRKEKDTFVSDTASPVLGQLHNMRAMATIGAVEIQQTQVRAIAVLGAAGIFEIRWLAAGMQNLHVNQ